MFEDLLMNPRTKKAIQTYLKDPAQALLIVGPLGSGKSTTAKRIAAALLNLSADDLEKYPYLTKVTRPEGKQEIIIDSIRQLNKSLSTKVPGKSTIRQIAMIEDAQGMNDEAQNAFLKSLEEPPAGTVFILTADSKNSLLPTVVSRTTPVLIEPVSLELSKRFYARHHAADVSSAWALSQGAPGLLASLLGDEPSELRRYVELAKDFLASDRYGRLVQLDGLKKDELAELLEALTRVLKALYRSAAQKNDAKRMNSALTATQLVLRTRQDLSANVSPRLLILNLTLGLPL